MPLRDILIDLLAGRITAPGSATSVIALPESLRWLHAQGLSRPISGRVTGTGRAAETGVDPDGPYADMPCH